MGEQTPPRSLVQMSWSPACKKPSRVFNYDIDDFPNVHIIGVAIKFHPETTILEDLGKHGGGSEMVLFTSITMPTVKR